MDDHVTVTMPYIDFAFSIPFLIFNSKNISILTQFCLATVLGDTKDGYIFVIFC
jgi:hypothetical protein